MKLKSLKFRKFIIISVLKIYRKSIGQVWRYHVTGLQWSVIYIIYIFNRLVLDYIFYHILF